ncbi:CidA/LrgA family protein [Peptoniphilus sp. MSJ-1]|uniref:CidA/LrgA family protein n=1 Tax=Peptoniphilus ovalis TaxID=2841503 RepID=A0ABS6FFC1_9FIRM|nr:CidA/LrgA family protein [Peptoniphilus ovalis]MBU5668871.1 CidA/LrgA family protein [Peptoniphilus ovalis]
MNYLKEFVILCTCLFLGIITKHFISFPIPEAVYGMIYLFIAFTLKIIKPDDVKKTSNGILHNLAILFVPAGVGIINSYDEIKGKTLVLVLVVVAGTAITMGLTGKIIELLQRRNNVR